MSESNHDPGRWLEGGDVDADLLEALEATQGDFPTDAQLAAVEGSILSAIGGGGGGGGSGSPTSIPPGASLSPVVPAALVAAALIGVGAIASFWPEGEAPSPALDTPAVVAGADETDEADDQPMQPARPRMEPAPEPAPAPQPAATAAERLDEGELLERARRRVRSSPAAALRLLRTHRSRFADGALAEERDALWVEALHERGRADDAQAAFDTFIGRYPSSVHRVHLRSLLGR